MKQAYTRRRYRRPAGRDIVAPKKDSQQDQQFFGETVHEPFFKPLAANQQASVQRKCAECGQEDKLQRSPDKKEEEKKLHRMPDKKEEEKVQRLPEKKEDKKLNRMPEKKEEEKIHKKEDKKEEEKINKKEGAGPVANTSASNYISSINGKGQSMDAGVQSFYESRMGADFSDVKIHTGKEAVESAKHINAQAYAYGNHIVFNDGKYQPGSGEGKHLLAHELAHVMQQKGVADNKELSRKINYATPVTTETEPVSTVLKNPRLALTELTIDGKVLPADFKTAGQMLLNALNKNPSITWNGSKSHCFSTEPDIELASKISIIKAPKGDKWEGAIDGADLVKLEPKAAACSDKGNVTVYIKGNPDAATIYSKIKKNEDEHVKDFKDNSKKYLEPHLDFIKKFPAQDLTGTEKQNETDCQQKYGTYVAAKENKAIADFLTEVLASIAKRDKKGGSHDFKNKVVVDGKDCFFVTITINKP